MQLYEQDIKNNVQILLKKNKHGKNFTNNCAELRNEHADKPNQMHQGSCVQTSAGKTRKRSAYSVRFRALILIYSRDIRSLKRKLLDFFITVYLITFTPHC